MKPHINGRQRLREWLDRARLNQQEFAKMIEMDPSTLTKILLGSRRPTLNAAVQIADITGIPVDAWASISVDLSAKQLVAAGRKSK